MMMTMVVVVMVQLAVNINNNDNDERIYRMCDLRLERRVISPSVAGSITSKEDPAI